MIHWNWHNWWKLWPRYVEYDEYDFDFNPIICWYFSFGPFQLQGFR